MSARVKVRAVIWHEELIAVHQERRRGKLHVTLPGGRVNERESITAALQREVREELDLEIEIGDLLFAAEIHNAHRHQELELIFEAVPLGEVDWDRLDFIDPADPHVDVLPRVMEQLSAARRGGRLPTWLDNLYDSRIRTD